MSEPKGKATLEEEVEEVVDRAYELIKIKLIKDNGEYKNDVFVCVNGMPWLIQRGIWVEIPRYVADVLDASQRQDEQTAELIAREVAKAESYK